jgi:hypothetical protein
MLQTLKKLLPEVFQGENLFGWKVRSECSFLDIGRHKFDLLIARDIDPSGPNVVKEEADAIADEFRQSAEYQLLAGLREKLTLTEEREAQIHADIRAAEERYNAELDNLVGGSGVSGKAVKPLNLSQRERELKLMGEQKTRIVRKIAEVWPPANARLQAIKVAKNVQLHAQYDERRLQAIEKLNEILDGVLSLVSDAAERYQGLTFVTGQPFDMGLLGERPPAEPTTEEIEGVKRTLNVAPKAYAYSAGKRF